MPAVEYRHKLVFEQMLAHGSKSQIKANSMSLNRSQKRRVVAGDNTLES